MPRPRSKTIFGGWVFGKTGFMVGEGGIIGGSVTGGDFGILECWEC